MVLTLTHMVRQALDQVQVLVVQVPAPALVQVIVVLSPHQVLVLLVVLLAQVVLFPLQVLVLVEVAPAPARVVLFPLQVLVLVAVAQAPALVVLFPHQVLVLVVVALAPDPAQKLVLVDLDLKEDFQKTSLKQKQIKFKNKRIFQNSQTKKYKRCNWFSKCLI